MKKIELLIESLLMEDASTNTSNTLYPELILPLVKKVYLDSLITQICDTQVLSSGAGKVAALYSVYSGLGSSADTHTHPDSSFIAIFDNVTDLSVGDIISNDVEPSAAAEQSTYTIRYIEDDKVLLSRETGTHVPIVGDTFETGTYTATYATYNRAAIKKLFRSYSGIIDSNGNHVGHPWADDDNTNVQHIGFETRTINTYTKTRKLKSRFSQDQLDDLLHIYKEKGKEFAANYIANEIRQEVDKELIAYLKYISKLRNPDTVTLTDSYGASPSGSLADVSFDLISNIYLAAEQIVKDTKRNRTMFVLADPITTAFLQTNSFHTSITKDENNPYRAGSIGTYPLYCDLFADPGEHYIIVGYQGSNNGDGDAGLIYSPYITSIHETTDANFITNILYMDRYAVTRHPQDLGNVNPEDPWNIANEGNSDFFKMFFVDFSALSNFNITTNSLFE